MLDLQWVELEVLAGQISRLQDQRAAARANENHGLANTLASEIDRAMFARERLISQITARISGS
jgi:hypothetical protein